MTTTRKRTPPQKQNQPRKVPVLGIVFVVVALALVAAIVFSSDRSIGSEAGDPDITGEALPAFPSANPAQPSDDAAFGLAAPAAVGEDFGGSTVAIDTDNDTAKAIVFLAHWSPHCQAEVPRVQAWLDAGGEVEGVEMISVTTSMNSAQPNYPPSAWLEREGWTVPIIRDSESNELLSAYGAGGFPYWVFVDADGNVTRRSGGELSIETLQAYMTEAAQAAGQ